MTEERERTRLDSHIATLDELDFQDARVIVRWLCVFEELATTSCSIPAREIVEAFAEHGWVFDRSQCKEKHETTAGWMARVGRDGQIRWLVVQALDCIARVGAPHQVIHKFALDLFPDLHAS